MKTSFTRYISWHIRLRSTSEKATFEMALSSIVNLVLCLLVSLLAAPVSASPVNGTAFTGLSGKARGILERATPAAPHWVVYADAYQQGVTGPPPVSSIKVWNTLVRAQYFKVTDD